MPRQSGGGQPTATKRSRLKPRKGLRALEEDEMSTLEIDRWERAWSAYVAGLARLDSATTRAQRRGALLAVAKARKALRGIDAAFMDRLGFSRHEWAYSDAP